MNEIFALKHLQLMYTFTRTKRCNFHCKEGAKDWQKRWVLLADLQKILAKIGSFKKEIPLN